MDPSTESWEMAVAELELQTALQALRKAQGRVTTKESALGVEAKNQLRHLVNSAFLTKRMNARALKTRIRERLRSRKFELDRLERSYRKQRSGMLYFAFHASSDSLNIEQNSELMSTHKIP